MGVGFATGVTTKEDDFLWLEAIGYAIADLLDYGWGEHISRLRSDGFR
jgi:hypothetical protein